MSFPKRIINALIITLMLCAPLQAASVNKATKTTVGLSNVSNILHNYTATAIPTADDDSGDGYSVGSTWWYVLAKKTFVCLDASVGSAVWAELFSDSLVRNNSGALIERGSVIYVNGAAGNLPLIAKAQANTEATSAGVLGFVLDDIADNGVGYIVPSGSIFRVNTSGLAAGNKLYLSANTAGSYIDVKPVTPAHLTTLGTVLYEHANQGIILIDILNGFETDELHNVVNTEPTISGQVLKWDNGNGYYDLGYLPDAFSGVVSWGGSGDYYDEAFPDGEFRLLRAGTGSIGSKAVTWTAPQDTGVLSANTANYIYIDSAGAIQSTTARSTAFAGDKIVMFIVLYDGTNYETIQEAHPVNVPWETSNDLHDTIGTVFEKGDPGVLEQVTTGTGAVATDRQLKQVGASEIHDHGIEGTFADSAGAGVSIKHYYTNASGKWVRDSNGTEFPMKYNNAGTPTTITTNRFGVFRVYYSKDDLNTVGGKRFTAMHTAEFTTQALAQTAINNGDIVSATNEFDALEMAQYGFVIVKNTASGGHIIEIDTIKDVAGGSLTQSGGANLASAINTDTTNFNGGLSAADTTVQVALETLDDKTVAASTTVSGIIEIAIASEIDTGTDATRAVSPDALAGSNFGIRYTQSIPFGWTTDASTGDGKFYAHIPPAFNGMNLVYVHARVITAGTTGTLNIDIYNLTQTADMLSTNLTVDSAETGSDTAATPAVIDTANDDVATNDVIRIDIDAVHTTPSKGLILTLGYQLP